MVSNEAFLQESFFLGLQWFQMVGILLWISAVFEKFIMLPLMLKKLPDDSSGSEEFARRKQTLIRILNSAALILLILGCVFFFGWLDPLFSSIKS